MPVLFSFRLLACLSRKKNKVLAKNGHCLGLRGFSSFMLHSHEWNSLFQKTSFKDWFDILSALVFFSVPISISPRPYCTHFQTHLVHTVQPFSKSKCNGRGGGGEGVFLVSPFTITPLLLRWLGELSVPYANALGKGP